MESILIQPKSKKELAFVSEMLKRLNIKTKILNDDEKEDLAMGNAIESGMKTKRVSRKAVMNMLKR